MSNQQLVQALKNPELRAKMGIEHPAGKAFDELSVEEMVNIQGAGDVQPDTTVSSWPCGVLIFTGGVTLSTEVC